MPIFHWAFGWAIRREHLMIRAEHDQARIDELQRLRIMGTEPEPLFDEIARAAGLIFDAPFSSVSFVGGRGEWFKARVGLELPPGGRAEAMCSPVVEGTATLIVPDTRRDSRFCHRPQVLRNGVRFYCGAPIVTRNNITIGAVCVKDTREREVLSWQTSSLEAMARVVAEALEARLKALETEEARAAADAANRAKSNFLANMSHEVRTPLNAILGFADLLADGTATPDEQKAHAETIRLASDHLLTMVNDLLDLSAIDAGQVAIEQADVDVARLLRDAAALLEPRAAGKGIMMSCATPPGRIVIKSDPLRLRQVLLNLIGNAVKFTELGGVTVTMTTDDRPHDRKIVIIQIADTGIGIAPEKLSAIFKPFTQSDEGLTRRFGGSGLGLAICQRLAAPLGASIDVQSELGKGSVFTLTIDAVAGVRAAAPGGPVINLKDTSSLRMDILYAEDGPDNQRLVAFLLRKAGATVTVAPNGREAVDLIKRGAKFDLVLMDMQMPEMDGYEATRELRRSGYEVPIVALTAHALADDRGKCLMAGCDDFLTKPIDRDLLVATCRRWKHPGDEGEKSVA